MARKQSPKLTSAFREVYSKTPSTVKKAGVTGARKTAMLRAIAFSKARQAGAKVPRKPMKNRPVLGTVE